VHLVYGALVAQAEIVYVTPTVTSYNATFEKVVLHITQLVGDDVPQGDIITSFGGTWTLTGGTFDLPGTSTTFKANIYNTGDLTPGAGGDIPVAARLSLLPTRGSTWRT